MTYLGAVLILAVVFSLTIAVILGLISLAIFLYDEVARPLHRYFSDRDRRYPQRIYDEARRNRRS